MIKVITIKYENEIHGKNLDILYDLFLNMTPHQVLFHCSTPKLLYLRKKLL